MILMNFVSRKDKSEKDRKSRDRDSREKERSKENGEVRNSDCLPKRVWRNGAIRRKLPLKKRINLGSTHLFDQRENEKWKLCGYGLWSAIWWRRFDAIGVLIYFLQLLIHKKHQGIYAWRPSQCEMNCDQYWYDVFQVFFERQGSPEHGGSDTDTW